MSDEELKEISDKLNLSFRVTREIESGDVISIMTNSVYDQNILAETLDDMGYEYEVDSFRTIIYLKEK